MGFDYRLMEKYLERKGGRKGMVVKRLSLFLFVSSVNLSRLTCECAAPVKFSI